MKTNKQKSLLIIEDSDEDFTALKRMIDKAKIPHPVYRCEDGEEALDFLFHEGEYQNKDIASPSLIILDLNLPGTDGREVLSQLKKDPDLQAIPVVIFSTSSNSKDINACYRHGISGYFVKPMNVEHLNKLVATFLEYWFKAVELPE